MIPRAKPGGSALRRGGSALLACRGPANPIDFSGLRGVSRFDTAVQHRGTFCLPAGYSKERPVQLKVCLESLWPPDGGMGRR